MRRLRPALLAVALAGALAGGCGDEGPGGQEGGAAQGRDTEAETEGLYLDAGGLKYQVQLSREMNPALVEDTEILRGIPEDVEPPDRDEVWFGVWVRVENDSERPHATAPSFEIEDTQGTHYEPVEIEPSENILAYEPTRLGASQTYPDVDSVTAQHGPREGAFVLFKLSRQVYENRPLEFGVLSTGLPHEVVATAELDL